jgi:hypothetical protein
MPCKTDKKPDRQMQQTNLQKEKMSGLSSNEEILTLHLQV